MSIPVTGVSQEDERLVTQPPMQWVMGFVPWRKIGRGVKLTAHLDLMLKLGICGATPLLPLYAFRTRAVTTLYKIQTPRNIPEESIQHSKHGESLKSRTLPSSKTQLKHSVSKPHKLKKQSVFPTTTKRLNLILLTWRIWWAPNNASKWQMRFNSAFKWLNFFFYTRVGILILATPC